VPYCWRERVSASGLGPSVNIYDRYDSLSKPQRRPLPGTPPLPLRLGYSTPSRARSGWAAQPSRTRFAAGLLNTFSRPLRLGYETLSRSLRLGYETYSVNISRQRRTVDSRLARSSKGLPSRVVTLLLARRNKTDPFMFILIDSYNLPTPTGFRRKEDS